MQLGAQIFHQRGLGDESNSLGHYAEWEPWREGLWDALQKEFPLKKVSTPGKIIDFIEKPKFLINFCEEYNESSSNLIEKLPKPVSAEISPCCFKNSVMEAVLLETKVLTTKDALQKTIEIKFEAPQCLNYSPGDAACIHPKNDPLICQKLGEIMGLNLEKWISIQVNPYYKGKVQMVFPERIKIKDLFHTFLDISSPPNRFFFKTLSNFAQDPLHKEKLFEMGAGKTSENVEDYFNYCVKERRNPYEILYDFSSVQLPLENLIDSLNLLQTRQYSIASSLEMHPKRFSLIVSLVEYKTSFGRTVKGLCSGYFQRLEPKKK